MTTAYPAARETTGSHTFEVKAAADGHFAVRIDCVRIDLHALEDDAHAHRALAAASS